MLEQQLILGATASLVLTTDSISKWKRSKEINEKNELLQPRF
jgi:urease accessory protein UreH